MSDGNYGRIFYLFRLPQPVHQHQVCSEEYLLLQSPSFPLWRLHHLFAAKTEAQRLPAGRHGGDEPGVCVAAVRKDIFYGPAGKNCLDLIECNIQGCPPLGF
jgi:hypothetical protein